MSTIISHLFENLMSQRTEPFAYQSLLPPDVLPISFKLINSTLTILCPEQEAYGHDDDDDYYDLPVITIQASLRVLAAQETIEVPRNTLRSNATRNFMADILAGMLVPDQEHGLIIEKVFQQLDQIYPSDNAMNDNAMLLPIVVHINHVTVECSISTGTYDEAIDRVVTMESKQAYEAKPVPADKSSIENLERVRVDDDESLVEARRRQTAACTIRMEEFEKDAQVARLPCSHIYRQDCIVEWLGTSHLCPLCRYPMPQASR